MAVCPDDFGIRMNSAVAVITAKRGGIPKGRISKGMKVRASVKKISPSDKIVRRKGRVYVVNKLKPRNKQRQG